MELEYGMIVEMEAHPLNNVFGFRYTSSNDPTYPNYYRVEKYWVSDTDPNQYKVRLKSCNPRFADESKYSRDLVHFIEWGSVKVKYIPSLFAK